MNHSDPPKPSKPPTPHMDTWKRSYDESRSANAKKTTMAPESLVSDRGKAGAYFVHETPLNHFHSSVARGSFAPSELAAAYSSTKPSHDAGKVQSGAFYTRQVLANPKLPQKRNTSTWQEGQVGATKPIAVVFRPDILSEGPMTARTIDGGNIQEKPVPQRTDPVTAAHLALKETERGDKQLQRNAEVAVSAEIPARHVAAVVVKDNQQLATDLEAKFAQSVSNSATFEGMGAAAHLAGRVVNATQSETRQQTIAKVHSGVGVDTDKKIEKK